MKASMPLALLALLFIISATANSSTISDQPEPPPDKPETPTDSPEPPPDKPETPTGPTEAPPDKPETPTGPTEAPPDKPETPTGPTEASPDKPETPTGPTEASPDKPETPTGPTEASPDKPETPTGPTEASPDKPETPTGPTEASPDKPETPTGPTEASPDKPETPTGPTEASPDKTQAPTDPTEAPTNTTEAPTNTTEAPTNTTEAPLSTASAPPQVTSSGPSSPCQSHPCEGGAACVELYGSSVCLCGEGYYYSRPSCLKGKTFPGEITVQVPETTGLDDNKSPNYKNLHDNITGFFQNTFGNSDYGQTVILKVSLSPSLSGRSATRADEKRVNVSLINILKEITNLTEEQVTDKIKNAIKSNQNNFVGYNEINSCEFYGCVNNDQGCSNSLQCECKSGLQRPTPLSHYCLPLACSADCSAEFNKQCLKQENGLKCMCLPGYQRDANDNCQKCPFGYSGVDCEDQFKLILTIVGTIAAVLILGLLISLVFIARSKNKKNDIEKENLIENDFQNLKLQSTGFSNLGADGSIFPKVRTSASKDIQAQNPYANQRSTRLNY